MYTHKHANKITTNSNQAKKSFVKSFATQTTCTLSYTLPVD